MAGPTIERSLNARRDVKQLALWIARESGDARATAVTDRLEIAFELLARRPQLGRVRFDFKGNPRSFSITPWVIVYEVLEDGSGIHLLRILDSRRDVAALMGKKS
jgi:toxin ParE1/3/4